MAHSCRWRFPARPGGSCNSGTGRRAGRVRVTASLRSVSSGAPHNASFGLGPGFDAALQVSSVIGSNLQKFRDVLGESSGSSSGEVSKTGYRRLTPVTAPVTPVTTPVTPVTAAVKTVVLCEEMKSYNGYSLSAQPLTFPPPLTLSVVAV